MGARVSRIFRNFNLENRVHREISREKPVTAPRHPVNTAASADIPNGECPLSVRGHIIYVAVADIEHIVFLQQHRNIYPGSMVTQSLMLTTLLLFQFFSSRSHQREERAAT